MINLRRSLLAPLLALALVFAPAAPALAAKDNAAIAINNEDGSSLFRFAFDVHRTMNSVIDETNIALAYASCEGCQTVAVAIQIVLVSSNPDSVVPENVAISINEECVSCETMASAYQFVVGTGGKTKLDKEGRKQIKDIRKAFYDLAKQAEAGGLTNAEIEARLVPLVDQIKAVLNTNVVPIEAPDEGDGADGQDGEGTGGKQETTGTEESPSPEPSTSPTPSAEQESPAPEETPALESAPSPTAEAAS